MATHYRRVADFLRQAFANRDIQETARLKPRHDPPGPRVPGGSELAEDVIGERWSLPGLPATARAALADIRTMSERDDAAAQPTNNAASPTVSNAKPGARATPSLTTTDAQPPASQRS